MCQMKSGIILKDRVFVPDYDSHTDMLQELGIADTRQNAERLFVRAELLPPDGDVFAPIERWEFTVDQDILPDWYVENFDKDRMVSAVKEWAKDRIHIGVNSLRILQGSNHYIKDCENVEICDNATVEYICGNATVDGVRGQAVIIVSSCGWKNKETMVITENATFKDCETKTIYQSGDWKLIKVGKKE